ncbi:MAG: hypothetical protein GY826_03545 [Fuerstiella sp.]|nr:hypothetical protein [Fuerstiella sp.]
MIEETEMPQMHISSYPLAETFDNGFDYGTQVDPAYEGRPFPFTSERDRDRDRGTITLTD